jgi:hypothetical protein
LSVVVRVQKTVLRAMYGSELGGAIDLPVQYPDLKKTKQPDRVPQGRRVRLGDGVRQPRPGQPIGVADSDRPETGMVMLRG